MGHRSANTPQSVCTPADPSDQAITRNGQPAVVLVSIEEWTRKTKREGTPAEFFAASPLRVSGLEIERARGGTREIDL